MLGVSSQIVTVIIDDLTAIIRKNATLYKVI